MHKKMAAIAITSALFAGCASVPMESREASNAAKAFSQPSGDNAGLYIYRKGGPGGSLKKDIHINDRCVGESAPKTFFYEEVPGGEEYRVSTESEFSPNILLLRPEGGRNYFIQQYIKMGLLVGGADLKLVSEAEGRAAIAKLEMARKGNCSN